jgi:DNA-binding response OmpR family regulator
MSQKILVVEDEAEQAKPFISLLSYKGYEIIHAENGVDAIALALKERPSLAIIDLLVVRRGDEMDGYDLIHQLRETEETKNVAILAWTGHFVQRQDEIRALRAGADDYVSKDVEFGVIEARIEALLRRTARSASDGKR